MTFKEYVFKKTSIKLNLLLSNGNRSKGVIKEEVIHKLIRNVDKYGVYKVIMLGDGYNWPHDIKFYWDNNNSDNYVYGINDIMIRYTIEEHRNLNLKRILK